jgi:hypothetical protein
LTGRVAAARGHHSRELLLKQLLVHRQLLQHQHHGRRSWTPAAAPAEGRGAGAGAGTCAGAGTGTGARAGADAGHRADDGARNAKVEQVAAAHGRWTAPRKGQYLRSAWHRGRRCVVHGPLDLARQVGGQLASLVAPVLYVFGWVGVDVLPERGGG